MSTVLLQACKDGNLELAKQHLSKIDDLGDYEEELLMCAIESNDADILRALLNNRGHISEYHDMLCERAEELGFLNIRDILFIHAYKVTFLERDLKQQRQKHGENPNSDDKEGTVSI